MFMVINKDKIISYLVSISTVAILFTMSFFMTNSNERIIDTSTKGIEENTVFFGREKDNEVKEDDIKLELNNKFSETK